MSHSHDGDGAPLGKVTLALTDDDLGYWLSADNPAAFAVRLVDFARSHHFEVDDEAWERDRTFLETATELDSETLQAFVEVAESAFAYLNSIVPEPYFFEYVDDVLWLRRT